MGYLTIWLYTARRPRCQAGLGDILNAIPIEFQRGDWACGVLVLWTRLRKPD